LIPNASRASTCNRQTEHNKKLKDIEEELAKTNRMIRLATPALSLDAAQSKQAGTSASFKSHTSQACAHTPQASQWLGRDARHGFVCCIGMSSALAFFMRACYSCVGCVHIQAL